MELVRVERLPLVGKPRRELAIDVRQGDEDVAYQSEQELRTRADQAVVAVWHEDQRCGDPPVHREERDGHVADAVIDHGVAIALPGFAAMSRSRELRRMRYER